MAVAADERKEGTLGVDSQAVSDLKAGSEVAFRELFFKYGKKLYYFSLKQSLSHAQAQGIVQEVFAKLWEVRETLDPTLSVHAYIFTIAKNLIYNKSRKNVNRMLFERYFISSVATSVENTEATVVFNNYKEIVEEILSELSPRVQKVFRMNRFEGIPNGEIAVQLGVSQSTVENQLHMALKYLREQLVLRTDIELAILWAIMLAYF